MGSNRADVEVSYDVSNDFFRLWLDERMNYTSAVYETIAETGPLGEGGQSLEKAQLNKLHILSEMAAVTPAKSVLDIGCGWGACLEYLSGSREAKRAVGVTLSTEQAREVNARKIPRVECIGADFMKWETDEKFDAVISICMIDHLCSPQEAREGKAVGIYREYFRRVHALTTPGAQFGLQAILRNRTPRIKKDLEDVFFTTKIFPGGLNPRLEDLIQAVNPYWEVMTVHTRREHYQRTTHEWLTRMRAHEATIREQWGDKTFDDYDRYLSTCVRAFEMHYSSLAQLELRRID
jgi:cyclopropane-fatty-acyl-phospholipid synthase